MFQQLQSLAVPPSRAPETAQADARGPLGIKPSMVRYQECPGRCGPGEVPVNRTLWRHFGPTAVFLSTPGMGIPGAIVRSTPKSSHPGSLRWGRAHAFLRKSTSRDLFFLLASPLPQRNFREEFSRMENPRDDSKEPTVENS